MKSHWHDDIQRHLDGRLDPEEAAQLRAALNEDPELRTLYLDYANLDVALAAAAEGAAILENETNEPLPFPQPCARPLTHHWRWVAAAAACAALALFLFRPGPRDASRSRADVMVTFASAQRAIARLPDKPATTLPAWLSPTASLLDQPRLPQ